ncbi:MAG: hypothetical protein JJT89_05120 [Nitriliruptoraceae bacterium]|nr:hypothetical protein [Nitriliruptoraceae bacterium]
MSPDGPQTGPIGEVTCVAGRLFCLSATSGQIRLDYDHGVYLDDTRLLSSLVLRVDGTEPHPLGGYPIGRGGAHFSSCVTRAHATDPSLLITRERDVTDGWRETIRLTNHAVTASESEVELEVAADFAYIFDVKHGRPPPPASAHRIEGGLRFEGPPGTSDALLSVVPPSASDDPTRLRWRVALEPQTSWSVTLTIARAPAASAGTTPGGATSTTTSAPSPERDPAATSPLATLDISCSDVRFERMLTRSILDLSSLVTEDDGERFLAAGTPWFLTLFGRDALWGAAMALPLGVTLAGETLRLLARYQGVRHDEVTEEAPGKIIHELRHGEQVDRGELPPCYYGTVDATPLFVILLARAWRWGLDPVQVEALLPHAERALRWMRDHGDPRSTGFLRYEAYGERRLANQGWKDSGDAISFADGRLATPPIALCEVQGYAHQAAMDGAALLDAFGRDDADRWRQWAGRLRDRFQQRFWVDDDDGGFPAVALDGDDRRVDAVTSNAGHLLGTGILGPDQERRIAERLGEPDLDCGWGLRTLSSRSPRFNPLSYHGGSVWPHDTAITIDGAARHGGAAVPTANALLQGLMGAAEYLDDRLPELLGGEQRTTGSRPLPYPRACRPQAWAAGASLLAMRAVLGIEPDVPNGVVHLRAMDPAPFAHLSVRGMPLAGGRLSVELRDGQLTVHEAPPDLEVQVLDPI